MTFRVLGSAFHDGTRRAPPISSTPMFSPIAGASAARGPTPTTIRRSMPRPLRCAGNSSRCASPAWTRHRDPFALATSTSCGSCSRSTSTRPSRQTIRNATGRGAALEHAAVASRCLDGGSGRARLGRVLDGRSDTTRRRVARPRPLRATERASRCADRDVRARRLSPAALQPLVSADEAPGVGRHSPRSIRRTDIFSSRMDHIS